MNSAALTAERDRLADYCRNYFDLHGYYPAAEMDDLNRICKLIERAHHEVTS